MAVGQWGDIITFECSDKYLLTMRNGWKRKASGRWEEHNMHASKTKLEYAGYDADEVEMEIISDRPEPSTCSWTGNGSAGRR